MEHSNTVVLRDTNEVYAKVDCDPSIAYELRDVFTFRVPGAEFSPKFRAKLWDGKIYLFNPINKLLYRGHIETVRQFCEDRGYGFEYAAPPESTFTLETAESFVKALKPKFEPTEHQMVAFTSAIQNRRRVLVSPTASGKSLIIYMLMRFHLLSDRKGLIIVPKVQLVEQLFSDFKEYSELNNWQAENYIHRIYSGKDKDNPSAKVYISTWQSLFEMPKKYFEQFDYVINDEVHLSQAKSLTYILENLTRAADRIGLTGTLSESKTHELVITGLFGQVQKVISTRELMDKNLVSDFKIKCLLLKHPIEACKAAKDFTFVEEMEYLVQSVERNTFITNLCISLTGNTLVLFQYVEKHGKILYDMIKEKAGSRRVFLIYGDTDVDVREKIRAIVEKESDAIIVASFGTSSTGTNIKNLHNVVFASPSKSRIRNLQSIGRALRKADNKSVATLYDIADDLKYKKYQDNYTLKHFEIRIMTYAEEKFDFKIFKLDLAKGIT